MTREEAINTVRNIYQTDKEKEALEILIPELVESEDERIRKELINQIEKSRHHPADKARWIAYLEKQKEHSMSAEEVLIRAGLKLYKDGNQWFILSGDIIQEGICGFGFTIDEALYVFLKEVLIMANSPQLKEQKQEKFPPYVTGFKGHPDPAGTSDLEEAAKEYASKTLCDPDDGPSTGLAKESFIAGAEWQKEQKPAEWSEEDEKDMAHIIRILDDCYVYGTHDLSKTDHENLVNKLKSLRPSWKPSEEQMKALYDACCIAFEEERDFHPSLSRLYHDLRKL